MGLSYSWRDLHRASGRIANWLDLAAPATGRAGRGPGREVAGVPDAVPGHAAGRAGLSAAEHGLSAGGDRVLPRGCASRTSSSARRYVVPRSSRWHRTGEAVAMCTRWARRATARCSQAAAPHSPTRSRHGRARPMILPPSCTRRARPGAARARCCRIGNLSSNALTLDEFWGFAAARAAGKQDVLLHALPLFHVHGLFVASHAALLAGARMLFLPKFDVAQVLERLPAFDRLHGRADVLHAAAGRASVRPRAVRVDATLHLGFGAAARGNAPRVRAAHRPPHPRALRHVRDGDAGIEPVLRDTGRAHRRHRRASRCRVSVCGSCATMARPVRPARSATVQVRGPECLRRLLAHAGEDGRRVHGRWLVQHRRRRPFWRRGTCPTTT